MIEKSAVDLLMAIGEKMSAEEMMLLSLQGTIAAEVEMKRAELQMNQKQFAQYMGVTQATVSKWESAGAYCLEAGAENADPVRA